MGGGAEVGGVGVGFGDVGAGLSWDRGVDGMLGVGGVGGA